MIAAALDYAARGWPVFPCLADGKAPLTSSGFKAATTDAATVTAWWTRWPDANIGIPTGGATFDVLDVDSKPDGTGYPALGRLARAGLVKGAHRLVTTPSGGAHLYYQPNGNGNTVSTHYLDVRGDGGYVIVPPSIIGGVRYTIEDDRPDATGILDWAACRRLLDPPRPQRAAPIKSGGNIAWLVDWLTRQSPLPGRRNAQLYWACCRAVDEHGAAVDLTPLVAAATSIGLDEREATKTAQSALNRFAVAS